jgi:hypothetical protein
MLRPWAERGGNLRFGKIQRPAKRSRRQFSGQEVVLGRNSEGIGNPIEEGKQGGNVHRLGNLFLFPAGGSQFLNIFGSGAVRRFCDQLGVFEQCPLCRREAGILQFAF